jgi:hypothetical protein
MRPDQFYAPGATTAKEVFLALGYLLREHEEGRLSADGVMASLYCWREQFDLHGYVIDEPSLEDQIRREED